MRDSTIETAARLYRQMYQYWQDKGFAPGIRDVMIMGNLTSTSVAKSYVNAMKQLGWLTWTPGKARTLQFLKQPDELDVEPEEGMCSVAGCGRPVWDGPNGMHFHLTKCERHTRADWEAQRVSISMPRRGGKKRFVPTIKTVFTPAEIAEIEVLTERIRREPHHPVLVLSTSAWQELKELGLWLQLRYAPNSAQPATPYIAAVWNEDSIERIAHGDTAEAAVAGAIDQWKRSVEREEGQS